MTLQPVAQGTPIPRELLGELSDSSSMLERPDEWRGRLERRAPDTVSSTVPSR